MTKKSRTPAVAPGAVEVLGATHRLTDRQREQLRRVNEIVTVALANLGSLELRRYAAEQEVVEARKRADRVEQELAEMRNRAERAVAERSQQVRAAAIASELDGEIGDWSIDFEGGVFIRGSAPNTMPLGARRAASPKADTQPAPSDESKSS